MPNTSDQEVAEQIGRSIDYRIFALNEERARLVQGPARIAEIDAELGILQTEKARIDARRPPQSASVITLPAGASPVAQQNTQR